MALSLHSVRRLLGTPWAAGNRMPGDPEPGGGDDLMSIQTAWGRQAELPVQRLQVTFVHLYTRSCLPHSPAMCS